MTDTKTTETITRESFEKKVARLAKTAIPATQVELMKFAAELTKVSESFDAKITAVEAQKIALVASRATLSSKIGECYTKIAEAYKK